MLRDITIYTHVRIKSFFIPRWLYRPQWPDSVCSHINVAIEELDNVANNVVYIGIRLSMTRRGGLQDRWRRVFAIDPGDLLTASSLQIRYWRMLCSLPRRASQLMGLRQEIYSQRSPLSFPRQWFASSGRYAVDNNRLQRKLYFDFTYLELQWSELNKIYRYIA